MIGERGGTTPDLDTALSVQEQHKPKWSARIRGAIANALLATGTFHSDDLLSLSIPAEHKNIVGAQVNALVRRGVMVETGERRASHAPESHGRKSNCYRIASIEKAREIADQVSESEGRLF